MGLITRKIPSLLNGVSQQPASLRRASQGEQQTNCESSLVDGLSRRPPEVSLDGTTGIDADTFTFVFYDDANDKEYMLILNGSVPSLHDLTSGASTSVTNLGGTTYFQNTTNPQLDFRAVKVGDEIYIVNTSKLIALTAATAGGTLKGTKQTFADLPTSGMVNGDVWKINGDDSVLLGAYYMKWNSTTAVWEESMNPGTLTTFDGTTMPYRLYWTGSYWATNQITWPSRTVGDVTVAPEPNFVGRAMRDIFFFRNRLGFIAGDYVVLSQSGPNYTNFWRQSVRDLLDNDRIDLRAANESLTYINSAIPFNKQLMLFAPRTQLTLGTARGQVLTPSTGSIDVVSSYSANTTARPIAAGNSLYFATETGLFAALREYSITDESEIASVADDVTAHVPSFIPAGIVKVVNAPELDMVFVLTASERERIYVYKYYWAEDQKLQSSWSYWEFPGDISNIDLNTAGDELIISKKTTGSQGQTGYNLSKLYLKEDPSKSDVGFTVYLDNRQKYVSATPTYDSGSDTTTWLTTTGCRTYGVAHLIAGPDHDNPGELLAVGQFDPVGGLYVTFPGDWTANTTKPYYYGTPYESRYRFSELFAREGGTDEDAAPVLDGHLQLRTMSARLESTGYLRAEVVPRPGADTFTYTFTGKVLGTQSLIIGTPTIVDATWKFPIAANSKRVTIDLVNDTHMPSSVVSIEWSGSFNHKAGSR